MSCRAWLSDDAVSPSAYPVLAICVGHSRYNDMGATACDGETDEWTYNARVAKVVQKTLAETGIESVVVHEYIGGSYTEAMNNLSAELKELGVSAAIELHFNAASPSAHGSEMLHWHGSKKSKALAQSLQRSVVAEFGCRDRGLKSKKHGDRGALFLRETHCPAVIVEPFFGTNEEDWGMFSRGFEALGIALADGFIDYYKK